MGVKREVPDVKSEDVKRKDSRREPKTYESHGMELRSKSNSSEQSKSNDASEKGK